MPFKDKFKLYKAQSKYRKAKLIEQQQLKEKLFNIENGNICSLCEKPLHWLYRETYAVDTDIAVALNNHRAICRECFETLKVKYVFKYPMDKTRYLPGA